MRLNPSLTSRYREKKQHVKHAPPVPGRLAPITANFRDDSNIQPWSKGSTRVLGYYPENDEVSTGKKTHVDPLSHSLYSLRSNDTSLSPTNPISITLWLFEVVIQWTIDDLWIFMRIDLSKLWLPSSLLGWAASLIDGLIDGLNMFKLYNFTSAGWINCLRTL